MRAFILAIATAVPQYNFDQTSMLNRVIEMCQLKDKSAQMAENLYSKTKINRRYSVLKDFQSEPEESDVFTNDYINKIPGTKIRNDIYIREAPKLAKEAAEKAIKIWNGNVKKITHIISVSCTGNMAPGIEFILQQELGLAQDVKRFGINFMCCFSAFQALNVANALVQENSNNRILIVCTELCSLHFQTSEQLNVLVGNAIFGDGSAAMIIGGEPLENEKPKFSIKKAGSYAIQNTLDKITWSLSDHGFVMSLDRKVPEIIRDQVPSQVNLFLKNINFNDLTWAVHPGGKAIIEAVEKGCNLNNEQTKSSWKILSNYGNMSSAAFLFVLDDIINQENNDKDIIGLGFGPGISLEMMFFERYKV